MAANAIEKVSETFSFAKKVFFPLNRAKITLLLLFEIYASSVKVVFLFGNARLELYYLFPIFQIPMLMKATSDDDNPTSGYIYQEINSILLAKLEDLVLNVASGVKINPLKPKLFVASPHSY